MQKFFGECVGGPDSGKWLVHWSRSKKYYRPMQAAFTPNPEIEAVDIGEYRLNDFGQWHWWPTEAGKAMDKLFGTPK